MAESSFTDAGRLIKMEVDYSSTVDEKLPICEKLTKEGKLHEALSILGDLEKLTRPGADTHSTSRVLVAIVQLCYKAKNWKTLNEYIVIMTKRRSQIKQAITKMIQECCKYVDDMPDRETQLEYIDTLRTVTAGKIYVEVERARLTHKLAKIKEDENKTEEAAAILQELQVETFGSMERKEKVELILEQMRLCLAKKDYIRTQIISKKISTKFFDDPSTQVDIFDVLNSKF
ncbi:26S proteasome non-ATPase regulatory subunit 12-like [Centruroides sculpturatus]|uniref:26S proteasome non-ATPase regulatory subunit 12-like n=1 Tax=Centruroides sculpturatus TaxID=218467 RepID=UPI000C6E716C|nr:26S proteasome non-ATPase regulatory subunit 12-like [Centruroides sculpturatus]